MLLAHRGVGAIEIGSVHMRALVPEPHERSPYPFAQEDWRGLGPRRYGVVTGRRDPLQPRRSPGGVLIRNPRDESIGAGSDPRVGSELLGYRLEALLGRGGMGVVYRAHDPRLKRDVALKLLGTEYASDRRFRERFLSETEWAASLEHPNVIPIHDAGEVDGQLYLVMRLAHGGDLKRLLSEERSLEPRRAISICGQIADALDAAHARDLVHRDVKPSNVLLDQRGHVYLADFGLSRTLSEQANGSETRVSLGTPAYVAPEQIGGRGLDGRADQYSLACLLTECLTGKPPFPRSTEAAALFAHLEEDPRPVPGLERVLGRALAKNPRDRHESCAAFVDAAREALGIAESRARRWPLALAAVATALAAAAALGAFLIARGETPASPGTTGRLIRIDPAAGRVSATIRIGSEPVVLAAGESGIWIADRADGRVRRVDPATMQVALETPAHGKPTGIALAGERVFVANGPQDASAAVIDAATGTEENVISLAAGGYFVGSARVAAGGSGIWVAAGDRRVGRLDVTRSRIVDPTVIPGPLDERSHAYYSAVAAADDAVWVVATSSIRRCGGSTPQQET
jgi:hypothetical protein